MVFVKACDLTAVYLGVKFSCKFTLKEIEERWYTLLYDPTISKQVTAIGFYVVMDFPNILGICLQLGSCWIFKSLMLKLLLY